MANIHLESISPGIALILMLGLSLVLSSCGFQNYLRNYTQLDRPRYVAENRHLPPPEASPTSLKIVSYNIKYALRISEAIALLRRHSELRDADVLLLQEMDAAGVRQIAAVLGYNYVYYPAVVHPLHKKDFGNAVLSRWPIIDDEKIILPNLNLRSRQRIAVAATLQVGKKRVKVFSVHMGIFVKPSERQKRMKSILQTLTPDIDAYVIGGDFNTFTKKDRQYILDSFKGSSFQWVTRDLGWTNRSPYLLFRKSPLDHIYVKNFRVIQTGKVVDYSASDHIPIWTKVAFQPANADRDPGPYAVTTLAGRKDF